jgi:hypothetical protein
MIVVTMLNMLVCWGTNTKNKIIALELPPLCMVTKNKFDYHRIGDQMFNFLVTQLHDEFFSIANFWLP